MSSRKVIIDCDGGNDYDSSTSGLRLSSIFVIFVGSLAGALVPYALTKTKHSSISPKTLAVMKYFGSGVIIATAFIHLLAPATEALSSPCLTGPITEYSWAEGIVLITIFVMFFVELFVHRYDIFGSKTHDLEADQTSCVIDSNIWENRTKTLQFPPNQKSLSQPCMPTTEYLDSTSNSSDHRIAETRNSAPGLRNDTPREYSSSGRGAPHYIDIDHFAGQLMAMFILEFGVIFHSIFIGLTLAVTANDEFKILFIVLVFHQTFEGLGLGSRLASVTWPKEKMWMPWAFGVAYGLSTPVAITVGMIIHGSFEPGSQKTIIVNGVFDSISAGILIYTGLVELMAHEFMFNDKMRNAPLRTISFACLNMCGGAALMAILGKWA